MSTEQLLADLDALDALFSDESKWTKGWFARDADGNYVEASGVRAVCWCIYGGFIRVGNENGLSDAVRASRGTGDELSDWNDAPERTFADVKQLIASTRARIQEQSK